MPGADLFVCKTTRYERILIKCSGYIFESLSLVHILRTIQIEDAFSVR